MARVELRDILTEADRAAAIALEVAPGQDRFVESVSGSLSGIGTLPRSSSSRSLTFSARSIFSSGLTGESRITAVPALIASWRCCSISWVKIGVSRRRPMTTPAWREEIVQPPWIACEERPASAATNRTARVARKLSSRPNRQRR